MMATRKTKRYDEGGMAPEMGGPRGPDENSAIGPTGEDPRGPLAAKLAGLMGGNKMMRMPAQPPQDQDGPANMAAMMGRTKEMKRPDRMPRIPRFPMDDKPIYHTMPYEPPMKGGKEMMSIPAMPPQDTPPERIIGEPMPDDVERRVRPMPMVSALKKAMSSRPNRGKNLGNLMGGFSAGGSVFSASKRGDGIAQKGKTRGKMC